MKETMEIMDIIRNVAVMPEHKVIEMYGTEWKMMCEILKSILLRKFEWKKGVTIVDIIDKYGEVINESYQTTKGGLINIVIDGYYVFQR